MKAADDRDRAIERLLQQSFKTSADPSDACLDVETLAALADGGLSGAARAAAESHLADCARCQAVMSTAARIEAIAPVHVEPAPRRWLAWLVPLTAAVATVAIWVAVPHGPDTAPPSPASSQSAQTTASDASAPRPQREPSVPEETQAAAAKSDQPSRDRAEVAELRKDADRRELDALTPEAQSANAAADRADQFRAAEPPARPAAPPAGVTATAAATSAGETLQAPLANSAATEKIAGGAVAAALPPHWRISGTVLEHSTDNGSTWSSVTTGVTSALTAVSSPSDFVVWVVGRGGVVLRTTDGRAFSRVAFREATDLSAVHATGAQSATVTSSDGRVFTTSDGGGTWSSR